MSGLIRERPFKTIEVKELHPTFAAEVSGVDFEHVSEEQFKEILAAMAKYGVCIFRNTNLTDATHVAFSRRFGELDNIRRYTPPNQKPRYEFYELFDAGNVSPSDPDRPLDPTSARAHANKGNSLFHADSSFNPRRASFSLLRASKLPPPGTGGDTLFADSRTAAEDLLGSPEKYEWARGIQNWIGIHSMAHSRKQGSPQFFADLDPSAWPMYRHRILQKHSPSNRWNLYVGAHLCRLETNNTPSTSPHDTTPLIQALNTQTTQEKYIISVPWHQENDLMIWDNRAVLHRAGSGSFAGRFVRDLRRTTVHDDGEQAWGLNPVGEPFPAFFTPPPPHPPLNNNKSGCRGVGGVEEADVRR